MNGSPLHLPPDSTAATTPNPTFLSSDGHLKAELHDYLPPSIRAALSRYVAEISREINSLRTAHDFAQGELAATRETLAEAHERIEDLHDELMETRLERDHAMSQTCSCNE